MDERRETKLGFDRVNRKELDVRQMDSAAGQGGTENAAKANVETMEEVQWISVMGPVAG
jgi:hypothetical protein